MTARVMLQSHEPVHGQPLMVEGTVNQVLGVLALESTRVWRHHATGWKGTAKVTVGSESATFPLHERWNLKWLEFHVTHRATTLRA